MAAAGAPLLSCREVSKLFGALAAVNRLSLDVHPGDILGIGGPNGAGKTTLFDVISGLNPASSGQVVFDGRDITQARPEAICHAGIARTFQLNAAFDTLSVRDNVRVAACFGRAARSFPGWRLPPDAEAAAAEALDAVGLAGRDALPAGELPVLDRKLLMLAGALATAPKLLLMDEPAGGLSPGEIDRLMQVVRAIAARGITIMLIEHVMRFLVQISTRVLILHHGERLYEGPPGGLARDRGVIDVYLGEGAAQRLGALAPAAGSAP